MEIEVGNACIKPVSVLANIPVSLDPQNVFRKLRALDESQIGELVGTALPLIQARACYRVAYVEENRAGGVLIEGVSFRSRVMKKNLDGVGRVFPHVITIGKQLEHQVREREDLLEKYYLDGIGNLALMEARKEFENHLCSRFSLDGVSYMSPGSLEDWPIEDQGPLFALLGDVEGAVGVKLNDTFLMDPTKSVSGIYFPSSVNFMNCKLCPRENCVGRRAKYDRELAREYGVEPDEAKYAEVSRE
jgi:hypothetical protein